MSEGLNIESGIIQTLCYFDVFDYPLTIDELRKFHPANLAGVALEESLEKLLKKQFLFCFNGFYSLQNKPELCQVRSKGNERAGKMLQTANRIGKILGQFPFVKFVGISGSLSKDYADENADIDYFIITKSGRLWIARTFLHVLKKFSFLFNKQDWYCMNYFIDENALKIAEENIFTATEVVTLKPVFDQGILNGFYEANNWVLPYFPNYTRPSLWPKVLVNENRIKKMLEMILDNRFGSWLDNLCMDVTSGRWAKKEKKNQLNPQAAPLGLLTGQHFARPNPAHLQKKILDSFLSKLKRMEAMTGLFLTETDDIIITD